MNFALKCWLKPPKVIAKYTEIRNTEIFTVEVYIRKQLFLSLRKQCVADSAKTQVDSHDCYPSAASSRNEMATEFNGPQEEAVPQLTL